MIITQKFMNNFEGEKRLVLNGKKCTFVIVPFVQPKPYKYFYLPFEIKARVTVFVDGKHSIDMMKSDFLAFASDKVFDLYNGNKYIYRVFGEKYFDI